MRERCEGKKAATDTGDFYASLICELRVLRPRRLLTNGRREKKKMIWRGNHTSAEFAVCSLTTRCTAAHAGSDVDGGSYQEQSGESGCIAGFTRTR